MASTSKQLEATVYHEAGHAIAAWNERVHIDKITTIRDEDILGSVMHGHGMGRYNPEWDNSPQVRIRVERLIRISLAGPIAQRKFAPRSWRSGHGQSDSSNAADMMLRIAAPGRHADTYMLLLRIEAEMIVEKHQRLIAALAQALIERRKMTGTEVRTFISKWREDNFKRLRAARRS